MTGQAAGGATLAERVQPLLAWVARQRDPIELELACAEHPAPERGTKGRAVVVLPVCAAELAEHLLYELLDLGAEHVWVRTDGCGDPAATEALLGRAGQVLAALGAGDRVRCEREPEQQRRRRVLDATVMAVSRRRLLMLPESDATPDPGASAHRRLVAALRALAAADADTAPTPGGVDQGDAGPAADAVDTTPTAGGTDADEAGPAAGAAAAADGAPGDRGEPADGDRSGADEPPPCPADLPGPGLALVSEGCTACGVCVRACPEDALALVDVAETGPDGATVTRTVLRQYPAACGGAGDCLELCPESALSAPEHWGLNALLEDDVVDLDEIAKAVCRRCGTTFPDTGAELCEVCAFRRANPFGATLPPAVAARLDPDVVRKLEGR
ncbi:MAG: ATP-binding protein [Actinomycetota bacterium]